MITRFSRQGISKVTAIIEYVNVPQNRILADANVKSFSFNLLANKFETIYYTLKTPTITVDVSSYLKPSIKDVVLDKAILEGFILNQIDKNLTIKNISISALEIKLENIDTKKVPVVAKTLLKFKKGFGIVGLPRITPDSILLRGPQQVLDTISEISTILFQRDDIDNTLNVEISLKPIISKDILVEETAVLYDMQVEEFSQKIITVPVIMTNAPENETIKIIPSTVQIDFIVSLSLFNEISATDFVVICDYATRNFEENFMIPEITKFPEGIKDAELTTKKIDFLIFK